MDGTGKDGTFRTRHYVPQRRHLWRNFRDNTEAHPILAVQSRPTKLLYMIGDKNRDTLPGILGGPGILLHSSNRYAVFYDI